MGAFILRRALTAVPLLLGVVTLLFFLLDLAPGDPTSFYLSPNTPPEVAEQLRENLGLDRPAPVRYVKWLGAFARGDFGYSISQSRPVADVLEEAVPNTLLLSAVSLALVFLTGIALGALQAVRQHSAFDRAASVVSLFFYSMPPFWLALMVMLLLALKAHQWGLPLAFPATGMTSEGFEFLGTGQQIADRAMHLALPTLTLTLGLAGGVSRYTRGQMLEVVRQDFIRTLRAKGLPERDVMVRHALRNSLIPVITLLGLYLPYLFSGTVFVETIFAWPGMGRVIFDAIFQRDYPLVMATGFLFAAMVVAGNLIADVLYAVADPRIRYD